MHDAANRNTTTTTRTTAPTSSSSLSSSTMTSRTIPHVRCVELPPPPQWGSATDSPSAPTPHAKTANRAAAIAAGLDGSSLAQAADAHVDALRVVREERVFKHFIAVSSRSVQLASSGATVDWDVVGHAVPNPAFATVFSFDRASQTTTLLVEYAQGTNEFKYTFCAGGFDPAKHTSIEDTARAELSEEAGLAGGELVRLLPAEHEGIAELKWCRNKFVPFLVLDPSHDPTPRPRDAEELIEVRHNVPLAVVEDIILSGNMMLPAVQTYFMAREFLRREGLI